MLTILLGVFHLKSVEIDKLLFVMHLDIKCDKINEELLFSNLQVEFEIVIQSYHLLLLLALFGFEFLDVAFGHGHVGLAVLFGHLDPALFVRLVGQLELFLLSL